MADDPKRIVEDGYDAIAERYASWRWEIEGSPAEAWLRDLIPLLRDGSPVLDLGCGNGEPAGRLLAPLHHYTAVDLSREQLARAEASAPGGRFIHADFTQLELEPEFFQAVVSVYAFNHVPRPELPRLLRRIAKWLEPDGYLLASFGCSGSEGVEDDWLGVAMFFASYTEGETLELIREAGFAIERNEVVPIVEPEGEARFLWILARKPPESPTGASG